MNYLFLIFLMLLQQQTSGEAEDILTLELRAQHVSIDDAKNIYVVDGPMVMVYDPTGFHDYSFSNMYAGPIYSIDVANPEQILLFYKEDQSIRFINQYFRTIPKPFSLKENGYENVAAACVMDDKTLYIFEGKQQKIIRLTNRGKLAAQSLAVTDQTGQTLNAAYMEYSDGIIYITDPEQGIFVFDQHGQYIQTLPITGVYRFRIADGQLIYTIGNRVMVFDTSSQEQTNYPLPFTTNIQTVADFQGKQLVVYQPGETHLEVKAINLSK